MSIVLPVKSNNITFSCSVSFCDFLSVMATWILAHQMDQVFLSHFSASMDILSIDNIVHFKMNRGISKGHNVP